MSFEKSKVLVVEAQGLLEAICVIYCYQKGL